MTGDMLNKVLIERLEVTDKRTYKKIYHIQGIQRLQGTMISIVLYKRIKKNSNKIKVMELTDFIKNFDILKEV